jgi:uncharacterized membrane protein
LVQRKVPPNDWYGFRTAATRQSESVWYEANARAGRDLFLLGTVVLVIVAVGAFTIEDGALVVVAATIVASVGAIVLTIMGTRYADRLLKMEQRRSPDRTE